MTTAFSLRFTLSWRSMNALTASTAEIVFSRINWASFVADIQSTSSDLSVEVGYAGAALAEEVRAAIGKPATRRPVELRERRARKSRREARRVERGLEELMATGKGARRDSNEEKAGDESRGLFAS